MRRWLATIAIGTSLAACKVKKHQNEPDKAPPEVDAMSSKTPSAEVTALRAEVFAKVTVWGRHEYVPEDWSLVDPNIEWALSDLGPGPKDHAAMVEAAAGGVFTSLTNNPAGLATLEKRLADRYAHPVITRDGDLVRIDLGVIAGPPRYYPRDGLVVSGSPLADDGLIASEVIRNLKAGMAAQPGAATYQVEVDVPFRWPNVVPPDWSKGGYTYVYSVAEDRIRVYQNDKPDRYYVTEVLGGSFDKVKSLSWANLTQKPMDRLPVRSFDLRNKQR